MAKNEYRQQMMTILKNLSTEDKKSIEKRLVERLLASEQWQQANVIGITISQPLEWSTEPIIKTGWQEGKVIVVPKCEPKQKKLHFYEMAAYDELEVVYYGLKEPKADPDKYMMKQNIDLLVVPGLVFNSSGYRIGFGGGYYDRFLEDYEGITVSLVSERQLIEDIPYESFDIPVDHIFTEDRLIK